MKLHTKLFIITILFLAVYAVRSFVVDYPCNAESFSGKSQATQTTAGKTEKAGIPLVTFVEIGAAKCIPCKAMQPIMKDVAEEYKGQVKVVFHDVWTPKGREDAEKYNIRMIPTQVFLDKDGKEYFRHEGYFPKEDLIRVIKMQGVK
jgi:thioredoxin 1